MSKACTQVEIPIGLLGPKWVELTDTQGVLRVLQPGEEGLRARGMIFNCPRCMKDPNKKHYCIFLFPNAPEKARPQGRFIYDAMHGSSWKDFSKLSLRQLIDSEALETRMELHPQDLPCRWSGTLINGVVRWRPNWFERLKSGKILR
jgi:hypothetical protein